MRLNEVIEAMEYCKKQLPESLCSNCPTGKQSDNCGVYARALQYLKLYQKSKDELHAMIEDYRKEIRNLKKERRETL